MGQPGCNDVTPQRSESYGSPSKGSPRNNQGKEEPGTRIDSPKSLNIECGIKAIKNFAGRRLPLSTLGSEFELLKRLSLTGGLRCKDLTSLLSKHGFAADCRYCSQVRTFGGIPLPSFVDGVIALKFKHSKDSHWVAWKNGSIVPDHGIHLQSVTDVYDYFPGFDGFGHRVALWNVDDPKQKHDMKVIEATYSVRCQSRDCEVCFRKIACVDSNLSNAQGFNFTCV